MVSTAKVGSMRLDPILHATLSGVLVDATRTLVGSCRSIQTSRRVPVWLWATPSPQVHDAEKR